ncbi:ComEA family DNA-binding protein [Phycicoccus sp. MAQZ13P-2]|uniref:ComEA family DNA-binding protein n=1 Tax=Phycicoccus mangrovi TaxID=2840470 RepID=UPI001C005073|nr:ComEA family DNA-binding protein [Phycicoccus mangrovi]MBT9257901.1 ComEA family DNA-binding protein [Phycicoccus mangrovi]MBT9272904.1 ComEA family DNA-binding protein [Phycicoccus mangrovi]
MRQRPDPDALSPRASAWLRSRSRSAGWVPQAPSATDADDEPGADEDGDRDEDRRRVRLPTTLQDARWQPGRSAVLGVVVLALLAALVLGLRVASAGSDGDVVAPGGGARAGPVGVTAGAVDVGVPTASASSTSSTSPSPSGDVVVHVVGRVRRPGVRSLPAGSRVADAVDAAGGATGGADLSAVNLARVLVDGEQVRVPAEGETPVAPPTAPGGGGGSGGASGAPAVPVSLSTADVGTLDGLPGIGPVLAQRIVDWRTAHGRFSSVDELAEVSGIGEKLLEQLRPLVVP